MSLKLALLGLGLSVALTGITPASAGDSKLLFFDPDANQERLLTITELFNDYLQAQRARFTFEPVASQSAFESRVRQADAKFAIVTSAYLQTEKQVGLSPLLVPEWAGSVYYRKQLVDQGKGPAKNLRGKTIAAVVADDKARALLAFFQGQGIDVTGAFIVSVAKDVDALLAMNFGQADAALVTASSIDVLRQLNPTAAQELRVLLQTSDILRAPLCELRPNVSAADRAAMLSIIDDLGKADTGQELMQVLSVSRWVPFKSGMMP